MPTSTRPARRERLHTCRTTGTDMLRTHTCGELRASHAGIEETLRWKYRYVDLRRERSRELMRLRHEVTNFMRNFFVERGFWEIETTMMIRSDPTGARDFVVPSRYFPGKFWALPQSPQQLKQILMVGGLDKYVQIARCFRDEDPRADRIYEL